MPGPQTQHIGTNLLTYLFTYLLTHSLTFLEAIVRVALLVPLPSAAQVKASGCGDAGECVKKLEDMEPSKLRRWASERAAGSPACTLY